MPWTGGTGRGFTTGRPWLPFASDSGTRNVAGQDGDPRSVLATYRALLALRRASPALHVGASAPVAEGPDVYAWRREHDGEVFLCAVNFTDRETAFTLPGTGGEGRAWQVRYDSVDPVRTEPLPAPGSVAMRPLEALVLEPR